MKNLKLKDNHIGMIAAFASTLIFCEITANEKKIFIENTTQLIYSISIFFFLTILSVKSKNIKFEGIFYIYILLVFSQFVSTLTSDFSEPSIRRFVSTNLPSILILITTINIKNHEEFIKGYSRIILYICAISVLYSSIGILQRNNYISTHSDEFVHTYIAGIDFIQDIANRSFYYGEYKLHIQRYAGLLPNPNGLGLLSAVLLGLSYNSRLTKKERYVIILTATLGLLFSFSRMGFAASFVIAVYMYIKSKSIRDAFSFATLTSVVLFSIIIATQPTLGKSPPSLLNHEIFHIGERSKQLAVAWSAFVENPWLGVGFGVGAEYLFPNNTSTQAVHSVFINSLVETGIIGTSLLITFWMLPIFKNNKTKVNSEQSTNLSDVIAATLLGLFVAEAFDLSVTRFHYIHLIFFTLIGTLISLQQKKNNTERQDA